MPLTCAAGASASSSAINAPHPAAMTMPVSAAASAPRRRARYRSGRGEHDSVDNNAPVNAPGADQPARTDHQCAQRADRRAAGNSST